MLNMLKIIFYYVIASFSMATLSLNAAQSFQSKDYVFTAHTVIDDLAHPWAVEWLEQADDKSTLLITERNGGIVLYQENQQKYRLVKRLQHSEQDLSTRAGWFIGS